MSTNRLARTTFLTVLAGLVGAMALLVGPAGAETSGMSHSDDTSTASGGALAVDGSVASGTAQAYDDSTASGSSVARDGSVASGCSTAIDESTASGSPCAPRPHDDKDKDKDHGYKPRHVATGIGGAEVATATRATSLAVTGSSADTMATMAGGMLVLGGLLVVASRRRSTI